MFEHSESSRSIAIFQCKCGSFWCSTCGKTRTTTDRINYYMKQFDYERTRHVILTVNPSARLWSDSQSGGLIAYNNIMRSRSISELARYLSPTRYLYFLEFHKNGFPHFHFLAEMPDIGMIGHDKLKKRWIYGNLHENYFHSENHFRYFCGSYTRKGYVSKDGEDDDHQITLPEIFESKYIRSVFKFRRSRNGFRVPDRNKKPSGQKVISLVRRDSPILDSDSDYRTMLSGCRKEVAVFDGRQYYKICAEYLAGKSEYTSDDINDVSLLGGVKND